MLQGARDLELLSAPTAKAPCGISRPVYFKRSVPGLTRAEALFGSQMKPPLSSSEAAKRGLRYERKVLAELTRRLATTSLVLCSGLPFSFITASGSGYAIPDALVFDFAARTCCVVEIKLRHSGDAWYQLRDFYVPIVNLAFARAFRICTLEICRYYDPAVKLPAPVSFVFEPELAFGLRSCFHPLMVWSDK